MTKQHLKNKIKDLEFWLENNLGHPDRTTIESDLRNLRTQLVNADYDN